MSFPVYPDYKHSGIAWLGEVPSHWDVTRLKWVSNVSPSNVDKKSVDGEQPVRLCNYTDVYYNDLIISDMPLMEATASDDQIAKFGLRAGDTIITKDSETPNDIARSAYVPDDLPVGVCGYHLSIVRPGERAHGVFIKRYFDTASARAYFHVNANGLTRVGLGQYAVDSAPIALPPMEEQAAIAAFLDRETTKIDALVAEQERLIALLREKRQAVISHAVTKGLNPDAPMKDSGIEWLGEIPAHWEILPLTRVVRQFVDYRGATPNKVDEGVPLLTAATIKEGLIDHSRDPVFISEAEYETRMTRGFPAKGDLLLTTEAPLGEAALIEDEHVAPGQRMILMKMEPAYMLSSYLLAHFRSQFGQAELWTRASGSTASGIRADRLRASLVAVPPLDEQQAIADYIIEQTKYFGTIEAEADAAITLLQERRAALISAAVTGKIDVRGVVLQNNVVSIDSARQSNLPPLRAVVGAYAIRALGPMGRMAVMKGGYLAEAHVGVSELGGSYQRKAAGPYCSAVIDGMERDAALSFGIQAIEPVDQNGRVTYRLPQGFAAPSGPLKELIGEDRATCLIGLLDLLKDLSREGVEAAATLYAVWNDLLAAGKVADDDAICNGVLNDWHPEKARKFKRIDLDHWLDWMRRNGLVPDGSAPRTDHQGDLFV